MKQETCAVVRFDVKNRMLNPERSLQLQFQGTSLLLHYLQPMPTPSLNLPRSWTKGRRTVGRGRLTQLYGQGKGTDR